MTTTTKEIVKADLLEEVETLVEDFRQPGFTLSDPREESDNSHALKELMVRGDIESSKTDTSAFLIGLYLSDKDYRYRRQGHLVIMPLQRVGYPDDDPWRLKNNETVRYDIGDFSGHEKVGELLLDSFRGPRLIYPDGCVAEGTDEHAKNIIPVAANLPAQQINQRIARPILRALVDGSDQALWF